MRNINVVAAVVFISMFLELTFKLQTNSKDMGVLQTLLEKFSDLKKEVLNCKCTCSQGRQHYWLFLRQTSP